MRAFRAFFLKETIEMAPATLLGMVVGAWTAAEFAIFDGMGVAQAGYVVAVAVAIGIWHGLLDRRTVGHAFVLHRPVSGRRAEAARWLAGWTAVTLIFAAFEIAKSIARANIVGYEELRVHPDIVEDFERYSYALMLRAYLLALLAWSALRLTVSWRGLAAPVLFSLLLPASMMISVRDGWLLAGLVFACGIYQVARFSALRKGGWA